MTAPTDLPARVAAALARGTRSFRGACSFLSILPIGTDVADTASDRPPGFLAGAMGWFPLAGAGIGGVAAAVLLAGAASGLDPLPAAVVAVAALALVTGGLHEDGLADVADGFGGGRTRADKLGIMRDSRVGSYGVLALVFSVLARAGALATLDAGTAAAVAVAAGALSRTPIVVLARWMPMARTDGLAAAVVRPGLGQVAAAAVTAVAVALTILGPAKGALALAAAAAAAAAVAWAAWRQIGGCTGDVHGASQQGSECAVLLVLSAA